MAKKSKGISKVSNGGRQKRNIAHEKKRQEKFAAKRGTDKEYNYTPNPYNPETQTEEYLIEKHKREDKAKSKRTHYARMATIFARLDNELAKKALETKKRKEKKFAK